MRNEMSLRWWDGQLKGAGYGDLMPFPVDDAMEVEFLRTMNSKIIMQGDTPGQSIGLYAIAEREAMSLLIWENHTPSPSLTKKHRADDIPDPAVLERKRVRKGQQCLRFDMCFKEHYIPFRNEEDRSLINLLRCPIQSNPVQSQTALWVNSSVILTIQLYSYTLVGPSNQIPIFPKWKRTSGPKIDGAPKMEAQ